MSKPAHWQIWLFVGLVMKYCLKEWKCNWCFNCLSWGYILLNTVEYFVGKGDQIIISSTAYIGCFAAAESAKLSFLRCTGIASNPVFFFPRWLARRSASRAARRRLMEPLIWIMSPYTGNVLCRVTAASLSVLFNSAGVRLMAAVRKDTSLLGNENKAAPGLKRRAMASRAWMSEWVTRHEISKT